MPSKAVFVKLHNEGMDEIVRLRTLNAELAAALADSLLAHEAEAVGVSRRHWPSLHTRIENAKRLLTIVSKEATQATEGKRK